MGHGSANHLFSKKFGVFLFNRTWISINNFEKSGYIEMKLLIVHLISINNFEKSGIYWNETFNRHVFLCAKYDNSKRCTRNFHYTHQEHDLNAPHFILWLPIHSVSLIEAVFCFSKAFHDFISFHLKQYTYLPISIATSSLFSKLLMKTRIMLEWNSLYFWLNK